MFKNKKHIIFDWNGTLVDDAWVFVDVLNQILFTRNLNKITLKQYRDSFCFPIKSFYKKLGVDVSEKSFKIVEKEFVEEYKKRMYKPALFNNVLMDIKKLNNHGFTLSILSASNSTLLNGLVKYYSLLPFFDNVVGVNNYGANGKIECGKYLINKLNLDVDQIMMIGDTDYDYDVSLELGLDCVLKKNGHQSINRLKNRTQNIIDSIDELID